MRHNEKNVTLSEIQPLKEALHDKSKTIHLWVFITMKVDHFHLSFLSDQICGALETWESKPYGHRKWDHLIYFPASRRLQCHSYQIVHSRILRNLMVRLHVCFRQSLQNLRDVYSYSTSQRGQKMVFLCHKYFGDVFGWSHPNTWPAACSHFPGGRGDNRKNKSEKTCGLR